MSDVMLYGVLRMPYEMAMNDELSKFQFYQRAQQALDRISELEKDLHMIQRHYDKLDDHPVKELTDEEITELANEYLYYISHDYEVTGIYKFARAILRKAQE